MITVGSAAVCGAATLDVCVMISSLGWASIPLPACPMQTVVQWCRRHGFTPHAAPLPWEMLCGPQPSPDDVNADADDCSDRGPDGRDGDKGAGGTVADVVAALHAIGFDVSAMDPNA